MLSAHQPQELKSRTYGSSPVIELQDMALQVYHVIVLAIYKEKKEKSLPKDQEIQPYKIIV